MFMSRNNSLILRQTYCILCVYTSILLIFFIVIFQKKEKRALFKLSFISYL